MLRLAVLGFRVGGEANGVVRVWVCGFAACLSLPFKLVFRRQPSEPSKSSTPALFVNPKPSTLT